MSNVKKFIAVPGNNSSVVKNALLDRQNWEEVFETNQCKYLTSNHVYKDRRP